MLITILAFGAGILILLLLFKIFSWPLKILLKLVVNAVIGAFVLIIFNLVGGFFGLGIPINPLNALIAGILGIPGVLLLLLFRFLF